MKILNLIIACATIALLFSIEVRAEVPGYAPDNPVAVTLATVFEWDAVSQTTYGEPVVVLAYAFGVFNVGLTNPIVVHYAGPKTIDSTPILPPIGVVYEVRVKATSTDGFTSAWSAPMYIIRAPTALPTVTGLRVRSL